MMISPSLCIWNEKYKCYHTQQASFFFLQAEQTGTISHYLLRSLQLRILALAENIQLLVSPLLLRLFCMQEERKGSATFKYTCIHNFRQTVALCITYKDNKMCRVWFIVVAKGSATEETHFHTQRWMLHHSH